MTEKQYTSHDLADSLSDLAEKLRQHPAFSIGNRRASMSLYFRNEEEKPLFLNAARVFGGKKVAEDQDYFYELQGGDELLQTRLCIPRSLVCKKVTKMQSVEVWQCEPLLSEAEEAEVSRV